MNFYSHFFFVYVLQKDYLCTMKKIPLCFFDPATDKNGLGVDVVTTESFRDYLKEYPVYRTNYFSIYLITEGREQLQVDGVSHCVENGTIVTSRPGELWAWQQDSMLEGPYLYFMEDFILSSFRDSQFINHFSFFKRDRPTSFLHPSNELFNRLLTLLDKMRQEANMSVPSPDILRAMLYEVMALLERESTLNSQTPVERTSVLTRGEDYYISKFQELASIYFVSEHQVDFYAQSLCITTNYLNKIVRQSLGVSTKQYLSQLLLNEAIRLLRYTSLSINEISSELHLVPAYFIKWFKCNKGTTPLHFQKNSKRPDTKMAQQE